MAGQLRSQATGGSALWARVDAAKDLVREVKGADRALRRLIDAAPPLKYLGSGMSSVVFSLGRDKVLRVTPGADLVDCEVPELLLERRAKGWPKVHHVITVEMDDGTACIVIAERTRPWSALSRKVQDELDGAASVVSTAHFRRNHGKIETLQKTSGWPDLSARAKVWTKQLWRGLEEIERLDDDAALDTDGDNFGLNSTDDAVWLDFGI